MSRRFAAQIICDWCGLIVEDVRENGYRYEFETPAGWSREKGFTEHYDFCSDLHRGLYLVGTAMLDAGDTDHE